MALSDRVDAVWSSSASLVALLVRSVRELHAMPHAHVWQQMYTLANRSWFFVATVLAFTGAIMVIQSCTQALRLLGDLAPIGPAFLQLSVREFGPTIVALMIAARYGAGIGAELGTMVITEQVDALRLTGTSPEAYLVAPRVLAGVLGMLPIAVFGTAIAYLTGGLVAHHLFHVAWGTYLRFVFIAPGDVLVGCIKAVAYGLAVPLVACHAGLSATGGAPGVGRATTRAVIGASIAVLFLDLVIGAAAYQLT